MGTISLRLATRSDVPVIYDMLLQSAIAQGGEAEVCVDPENLLADGFSANPRFQCLLAEWDGQPAGLALYFFIYSTWTSRNGLYLEDLYVAPQFRRHGVARSLITELEAVAQRAGCRYMRWLVLRGNQSAIRFYATVGAKISDETGIVTLPVAAQAHLPGEIP
ncbi:MAG TPA: GNAT family N-acetyltransferase [Acidobacteriaceae bacterium]|jgi:GNAT superfamily N-acetyltransferase|nr:GNAT family N-acetyltransferase [Acidobacteriaceae bacterium]